MSEGEELEELDPDATMRHSSSYDDDEVSWP